MPIDAVPDDVDALRALVNQLSSERDAAIAESRRLTEQNDQLRHLLKQLQRAQFGQRSERLDRDQMQLALEDIETSLASRDAEEEEHQSGAADKPAVQRKKRRINRGALPAHFPHVHVTLEPESTVCPCCHGAMHVIGEENSQRLDKIPARYQVIVTHRPKYGCRACEGAIVQAPAPERLIKSGIPTEGLVASVVVDKFAWHNPLYRQAQIMKLQGLPVDRSTLAFWVGVAAAELKPVYLRISEKSTIAEAIRYGFHRWDGLVRFLDDGRIEMDTNSVERAMRPIALNRKNSLFAGHDDGAVNWACLASLIETAKLHGIDPQAYLADILAKLVNGWPVQKLDQLLPWAWAEQTRVRLAA